MITTDIVTLCDVRHGCLLLCKKRGLPYLIQPGGKPEPEEKPLDTLQREVKEELGVYVSNAVYLTTWRALPMADPDRRINIISYEGRVDRENFKFDAEIEDCFWYNMRDVYPGHVAPSLEHVIIPFLLYRYS